MCGKKRMRVRGGVKGRGEAWGREGKREWPTHRNVSLLRRRREGVLNAATDPARADRREGLWHAPPGDATIHSCRPRQLAQLDHRRIYRVQSGNVAVVFASGLAPLSEDVHTTLGAKQQVVLDVKWPRIWQKRAGDAWWEAVSRGTRRTGANNQHAPMSAAVGSTAA